MLSRLGAISRHVSAQQTATEPAPWVFSGFADEAGKSIEEQIAAHEAAGMTHIDIRGVEGFNITTLPLDVAQTVKAKMDAAGMSCCMFGSPIGKIDVTDDIEIDLEKLRHLAKLKPIFGTNKVRMFSYHNKNKIPAPEFERAAIERVGQLKALAKELGMCLYHENEKGIYGEQLQETLNLLRTHRDGETFFGIFDASNFNQSGDDCWVNWQALRDHTDALHLKDSDDDGAHTPVGQGNGFYAQILADLVKCALLTDEQWLACAPVHRQRLCSPVRYCGCRADAAGLARWSWSRTCRTRQLSLPPSRTAADSKRTRHSRTSARRRSIRWRRKLRRTAWHRRVLLGGSYLLL